MKIRTGFVSNSSSSSFVLVVSLRDHNNTVKKLSEEHQGLIKQAFYGINPQRMGSEQIMVITGESHDEGENIGDFSIPRDLPENQQDDWWDGDHTEFWRAYREALPKDSFFFEETDT